MSLDNLKLSPFLITELYENTLTGIDVKATSVNAVPGTVAQKKAATGGETDQTRFLGEGKKNILVLVKEQQHPFAGDEDLNFLINILRACTVSMEDIALVNCFDNPLANYDQLNAQFSPEVILFLGPEPQHLGFPVQIPRYRVQKYNKQQYLSAPALGQLSADKEAKKELWNALKQIFSIA